MTKETKEMIIKTVIVGLLAALGFVAASLGLTSCNVTRTVTTQSQYYQRGDTTCTIVTKTIESYDGSRK